MQELAASNNMILLKTEGSYEKSSAVYGDGGFPLPKQSKFTVKIYNE